jgi:hypothetical protein
VVVREEQGWEHCLSGIVLAGESEVNDYRFEYRVTLPSSYNEYYESQKGEEEGE